MPVSSWKKREIANREIELLGIARRILLERGVGGLTMERIAAATEYSKGTIYQHFASKEDVIAAISMEVEQLRYSLVQRAAKFRGNSRERVLAMSVALDIIYRLYPEIWRVEELMGTASIREKLPEARKVEHDKLLERTFAHVLEVIQEGISAGDLAPPAELTGQQVFLGLVAVTQGLYRIWAADWWNAAWVADSAVVHERIVATTLDGYNWKPLSRDFDYASSLRRVWTEVFPEEYAKLQRLAPRK